MKRIQVLGHAFDCLPGHVTINALGVGSNLRVACREAIANMLRDPRLRKKHLREFKVSFVAIDERKEV